MKIGLLTFPLNNNYGNLLQAYALLTYLKNKGFDAELINFPVERKTFKICVTYLLKKIFLIFFNRFVRFKFPLILTQAGFMQFIKKYINPKSRPISNETTLRNYVSNRNFNCIIVGSDQIWRYKYLKNRIPLYFLSFVPSSIDKVAYAASFGVDEWQFSDGITEDIKKWITGFKGVSVREESAVKLCRKYLNVTVQHVLDPAFLINAEDYLELVPKKHIANPSNYLFTYLLDERDYVRKLVLNVKDKLGIENLIQFSLSEIKLNDQRVNLSDPVGNWIFSIYNSKFVITDSFHGTVFAIIFNKPFIVIGNIERGLSRIQSILSVFGLEDRLIIDDYKDSTILLNENINWQNVNSILKEKKSEAEFFLLSNINSKII